MSITTSFDFGTSSEYTYDNTKIQVTGGSASLKLIDNPGNDFTQAFTATTGFTYDTSKTEFSAGIMMQKDTRPSGAALYIPYSTDINGAWGNGVLTGTGTGSPAIVGGKLDLTGAVNKYVTYDPNGNADNALKIGAIRWRYTPNYSGTPTGAQNQYMVTVHGPTLANILSVYHAVGSGYIYVSIYNSSAVAIFSSYLTPAWSPVAGTEYEFELNYNIDSTDVNHAIRLFVNGVQYGSTSTATGNRTDTFTYIVVGRNYNIVTYNNNFSIRNLMFFDTVQHTANYTPDWSTIHETIYVSDTITVPEMEYTGAGTLVSATNFVTTQTGDMRYTLQIGRSGNYLYWNGSAWATSNNTYAQATSAADFLAHIAALPVDSEIYGQFRVYTSSSNTQQSIDSLTITLTAQIYPLTNPTIIPNTALRLEGITSISVSATATGSDALKYAIYKDSILYYYTGSAWAVADGTYTQTNTLAQINSNIATLITGVGVDFEILIFLHSDSGITTPSISTLTIVYNFTGDAKDTISRCIVWGYLVDPDTTASELAVSAKLNDNVIKYKNNVMIDGSDTITATVNTTTGYWELELIETANMPSNVRWNITVAGQQYSRQVPNSTSKNFYELTA